MLKMLFPVCGLIEPKELNGPTMTHEHLTIQADAFFVPPDNSSDQNKVDMPFAMNNLGWIRQNP